MWIKIQLLKCVCVHVYACVRTGHVCACVRACEVGDAHGDGFPIEPIRGVAH